MPHTLRQTNGLWLDACTLTVCCFGRRVCLSVVSVSVPRQISKIKRDRRCASIFWFKIGHFCSKFRAQNSVRAYCLALLSDTACLFCIICSDFNAVCFRRIVCCWRLMTNVDETFCCWFVATDRKTNSTSTTPTATLPPPLTALGPRSSAGPSSPSSPPYYPSGCGSTLDRLLPPQSRQIGDRSSDTYIPLDECYSGARPVTHHPQSANASPQVCMKLTEFNPRGLNAHQWTSKPRRL